MQLFNLLSITTFIVIVLGITAVFLIATAIPEIIRTVCMLSVAKKYHLRYSPNYFVTLFKQPETWKQHILEGNIAGYDVMVYDLHEKYDSDELGISSSDLDMGRNKNLWITKTVILKDHNQIFSQTGRVSVAKIINILANIQ